MAANSPSMAFSSVHRSCSRGLPLCKIYGSLLRKLFRTSGVQPIVCCRTKNTWHGLPMVVAVQFAISTQVYQRAQWSVAPQSMQARREPGRTGCFFLLAFHTSFQDVVKLPCIWPGLHVLHGGHGG